MKKSEGHRIRARISHFEENEPNISYHARMEKVKFEGNTIHSLYDKNGIQLSEASQILNPSDTKGLGTTSDTRGVGPTPLLSQNPLDLGT